GAGGEVQKNIFAISKSLCYINTMLKFVLWRNIIILVTGVWLFEYYLDYRLPAENNLLLFFVAIPIIWAALMHLWTSYSYSDVKNIYLYIASHILSILIMFGSVFLISAVLNTLRYILDPVGSVMFHLIGWTVLGGMIIYDCVIIAKNGPGTD
ncbi:MAG TPA: hypothetical protein PK906_14950, partial [Spirochaetota bacterium]|nr:hypothetical protein [Spirochaetota bacterium]